MDPTLYVTIDMTLSFGVVLAVCFWELYSVSKAKKARLQRELSYEG
jgi:hypothetical protein